MVLCLLTAAADAGPTQTRYMVILMQGRKIGHVVQTRSVENSHVITTEEAALTVGRGGQPVTVTSREMYIETDDGQPLSFEMTMQTSSDTHKTSGTIKDDKVHLTSRVMGTVRETVADWPAETRMPEGTRLLQQQKGLAPGTEYRITTFLPDKLMPVPSAYVIGQKQKVQLLSQERELTEIRQTFTIQGMEYTVTHFVDDEYNILKRIMPMAGTTLEYIACDRETALRENDIVDLFEKLSIPSPVQLTDLNTIHSVTYKLKPTDGHTITLPNSSHQKVRRGNDSLMVTVQRLTPPEDVAIPYDGTDPNILQALKPAEFLQADNEQIIDLARHAIGGTTRAARAARRIESFVAGYIQQKDMSVGYASAVEVAQSRQGDCSEHAVLAAAMCRAVGIPARVVSGLIYNDAVSRSSAFSGHMWVEVYIGGQWYGLDATPQNGNNVSFGFSPAHIAMAHGDGSPTDFFNLVNILGCFTIEEATVYRLEAENTQ